MVVSDSAPQSPVYFESTTFVSFAEEQHEQLMLSLLVCFQHREGWKAFLKKLMHTIQWLKAVFLNAVPKSA